MRWDWIVAFVGGGATMKIINLLIAWAKEKREQRAHEILVDGAATNIDSNIVMDNARIVFGKTAIVKILSLGSLPLTIKEGNVRVESSQHEKPVESISLSGRKFSNPHPITEPVFLKNGIVNPPGIATSDIKLIIELACESGETYSQTYKYQHSSHKFMRS